MNEVFNSVTPALFKAYYYRDFPFLPVYENEKTYFKGDVVYYISNFYKSKTDDNTSLPTDTDKWVLTQGDKYAYITDEDISKAIGQALLNANEDFGANDEDKRVIFLHLVAFYLVMDLKNSSAGINSSYSGLVSSKSVGDVSTSYNFPQWVINSPMYGIFSQNGYGMKYLSLIIPYLSCTVLFSPGRTTYG